jgi:hypothetical protein
MKFVINTEYGGFEIPPELLKEIGIGPFEAAGFKVRTHPKVIEWAEKNSYVAVVDIADNVYWELVDYDGIERIFWSESEIHIEDGKN